MSEKEGKVSPRKTKKKSVFSKKKRVLGDCGFNRCSSKLPPIIEQTCEYLEKGALQHEGLFRISGSQELMRQIKDKYDRGKKVDLSKEKNPNTVAGVLKLFFTELPNPLLTYELYGAFLAAISISDPKLQLLCLRRVIDVMPPGNIAVMDRICGMFNTIALFEDDNKMSAKNIALVLNPTLFRDPSDSLLSFVKGGRLRVNLVETLITKHKELFLLPKENLEKESKIFEGGFSPEVTRELNIFNELLQQNSILLAASLISEGETEITVQFDNYKQRQNNPSGSNSADPCNLKRVEETISASSLPDVVFRRGSETLLRKPLSPPNHLRVKPETTDLSPRKIVKRNRARTSSAKTKQGKGLSKKPKNSPIHPGSSYPNTPDFSTEPEDSDADDPIYFVDDADDYLDDDVTTDTLGTRVVPDSDTPVENLAFADDTLHVVIHPHHNYSSESPAEETDDSKEGKARRRHRKDTKSTHSKRKQQRKLGHSHSIVDSKLSHSDSEQPHRPDTHSLEVTSSLTESQRRRSASHNVDRVRCDGHEQINIDNSTSQTTSSNDDDTIPTIKIEPMSVDHSNDHGTLNYDSDTAAHINSDPDAEEEESPTNGKRKETKREISARDFENIKVDLREGRSNASALPRNKAGVSQPLRSNIKRKLRKRPRKMNMKECQSSLEITHSMPIARNLSEYKAEPLAPLPEDLNRRIAAVPKRASRSSPSGMVVDKEDEAPQLRDRVLNPTDLDIVLLRKSPRKRKTGNRSPRKRETPRGEIKMETPEDYNFEGVLAELADQKPENIRNTLLKLPPEVREKLQQHVTRMSMDLMKTLHTGNSS